ncbi:hypothetical protein D3C75_772510 [compost metagenome]
MDIENNHGTVIPFKQLGGYDPDDTDIPALFCKYDNIRRLPVTYLQDELLRSFSNNSFNHQLAFLV